jgi:hypothetical protein
MAANLLKAGYPVVVHSRSQGPVNELVGDIGASNGTLSIMVGSDAAEALALAKKLLGGFAQSRVLEVHGFKTHLFAKDMRNVVSTLAAGRGEDDNSIMAKTVFDIAGVK